MKLLYFSGLALACTLMVSSFTGGNDDGGNTSLPKGTKFIDPAHVDNSVKPGDDFYTYANGTWMKNTSIPASETRWGSFNLLEDFNKNALHTILEDAAKVKNAKKGSPQQMVGDLYRCGMDVQAIDKAGISAISEQLKQIEAISSSNQLIDYLAAATKEQANPLFAFYIGPDDKEVSKNICNLFQGGLGLPDRDYYLKTEKRQTEIREKYKEHVKNMLVQSGESASEAEKHAQDVLSLETELAKASMDRVTMRDPYKLYNKMSLEELSKKTGVINWQYMFIKMGVPKEKMVIVGQPDFFQAMAGMIQNTPIATWKTYLKWHCIHEFAGFLSSNFDNENFNFYGKTLRGQQEQKPRWKRVLGVVDGAVGHQLGKMYTDRYFTAAAKKRMLTLVNNLQNAFEARINTLDWMSAETKVKAKEKLHTFIKKIGYPDKWRSYAGLTIVPDSYVKNIIASNKFDYNYMISKLGKPVDRTEWGMTPPTVNAYYNPAFNEIVFPAGILQYPFFDMNTDDAAIYGAIGAVIGHEMTHGFDDQGCEYAADGNLKNWWNEQDKTRFEEKTKMVKEQYDGYTILDGKHVNGALTLGENIADLGGITIAYDAFKKTKQGQSNDKIDGFTPDQRFFMSWAQVWRQNIRNEEAEQRLVTDVHSPGIHRCNGPLSNFAPFYAAYNLKPGDKMYKPENQRAKVW